MLLLFFALQSFQPFNQQNNEFQQLRYKLLLANYNYPSETIYLQTDRPSYWANDDIWFKAYLQSTVDSSNIYVELINSTGDVIIKKIYIALDGLAYGDIHLPDTISSGIYQIRSYTNWMRNFEHDAFYQKNFIVWNLKDKQIGEETAIVNAKEVAIQFFPEGGSFVAGIKTKLGFKAVDDNGIGIDISGIIKDSEDRLITSFKSLFKGMGSVEFQPESGQKYTAYINLLGKTKKVALPEVQAGGVALTMETRQKDKLLITITEIGEDTLADHLYYLLGQTRGVPFLSQEIDLSSGIYSSVVDKQNLPSGVFQLTLFDSNQLPKCERLAFINRDDYVHLNIQTNKDNYSTREEVLANISSFSTDSIPLISNLSFTAYASESQLELEEYSNNILTHFLLNSDLKGRIEEPAYYFKDTDPETLAALDNLMLTQGWRRFTWKEVLDDKLPPIEFQHESSIIVQGTVSTKFLEKPLRNSIVTLIFDERAYKYYQQTTDSLGRFYFDNFYFFNETSVLIKSEKENGKTNTWLEIDDRSQKSPELFYKPVDYTLKNEKKLSTTYQVSIKDSGLIQRKWHVTDTILLNDIDIFGVNKQKANEDDFVVFAAPDMTMQVNDDYVGTDIFEYMQYKLPSVHVDFKDENQIIRISGNYGPALLLLDGFPIDMLTLQTMPISSFEKVEVQKIAVMYGSRGINGAINFSSKRGVKNTDVLLPAGIERINLKGYAVIREFYSPNYKDSKPSVMKNDFRSTLYWHPNLWTNENGSVDVSFYNSDQPGEVQIIVEGLSIDGRLCRGTCTYSIQP